MFQNSWILGCLPNFAFQVPVGPAGERPLSPSPPNANNALPSSRLLGVCKINNLVNGVEEGPGLVNSGWGALAYVSWGWLNLPVLRILWSYGGFNLSSQSSWFALL